MHNRRVMTALLALVLAALACQAIGGGGGAKPLFEEDFSSEGNGWDKSSGDNSSVDYANGEYVFQVHRTSWFAWANPEGAKLSLSNIHIETTARSTGAATEPGFGVMCDYVDGDNTYYMGVSSDGYYVIAKTVGSADTVLSHEDSWTTSDLIPQQASQYRIGADCGNGKLTLYVERKQLASVNDSTFGTGTVGLFVQSFDQADVEVHFDNYVVTPLK